MICYENILRQLYQDMEKVVGYFDDSELYPVMGADNGMFFCELSSGELMDRKIYVTLWYHKGEYQRISESRGERDMCMILPDPALFVAVLGILQKITRQSVKILHPLIGGDYLPGWTSFMDQSSIKQVKIINI
ncbi:MAG: hypothetical protein ACYCR3_06135 [Acidithiobacillus sp.]